MAGPEVLDAEALPLLVALALAVLFEAPVAAAVEVELVYPAGSRVGLKLFVEVALKGSTGIGVPVDAIKVLLVRLL